MTRLALWLTRHCDGGWHRWFAWRPVYCPPPSYHPFPFMHGSLVWLDTVERRWDDGSSAWGDTGNWEYRLV